MQTTCFPRSGDSHNLLATMPVDTSQSTHCLGAMGGYRNQADNAASRRVYVPRLS